tara:strand:- start:4782 stop:5027 length:246 start_codon:yes stop_codon:yes gene_type:complete
MTFLIVVLMNAAVIGGPSKLYVFVQPTFDRVIECQKFVGEFHQFIYKKAAEAYKNKIEPKQIYCIEKDTAKKLIRPQGVEI